MIKVLTSVGFNEERQKSAIGALSGGWKMKLALARAMLFKADILLLDEPTNHLDVVNIAWLENYLTGLTHCTSIIVSNDSSFLNHTIIDVLHLNRFKLRRYHGNLEAFVKVVPEAKSYYTNSSTLRSNGTRSRNNNIRDRATNTDSSTSRESGASLTGASKSDKGKWVNPLWYAMV